VEVLDALVLVLSAGAAWPVAAGPDRPTGQFPAADNDAAWRRLPRDNPPLPPWARVLVGPLTKTTAKMNTGNVQNERTVAHLDRI